MPPLFGRVFASRSAAPLLTEVGKARDALLKIVANNNSFLEAGGGGFRDDSLCRLLSPPLTRQLEYASHDDTRSQISVYSQ